MPTVITGADLRRLRRSLGLSCVAMGRALGYSGNDNTASLTIRRYESGKRPIPPWLAYRIRVHLGLPVAQGLADPVPSPPSGADDRG